MAANAFATLSERLCPWLREPLRTLEAAHAAGRLAHAWLIAGPPGLGKLNLALVLAMRLLHERSGTPAPPELPAGDALDAMLDRHAPTDHHPDLHWLFPDEDKRTISVDQVRAITEALTLKGFHRGPKVVVIEPAEAMTGSAANALLKSLEEPRPDTYMLLVSHQPGRLPGTIRSRCQTIVVRPPRADSTTGGRDPASHGAPPLRLAQETRPEYISLIKEIESSLELIYQNRSDPQAVAEAWLKQDSSLALDRVIHSLQSVIRARIRRHGRTLVTDPHAGALHNYWPALTLRSLFDRLATAEALRDRLGGGINVELALGALLSGFIPTRERP